MHRWLAWIVLAACARTSEPARPPPTTGSAAAPPPGDATPVAVATGCIADPAAQQACLARGPGNSYGPSPFIYCSGVAADTAALARQHAEQQKTQPCSCNNEQAIQRRREACSMVP